MLKRSVKVTFESMFVLIAISETGLHFLSCFDHMSDHVSTLIWQSFEIAQAIFGIKLCYFVKIFKAFVKYWIIILSIYFPANSWLNCVAILICTSVHKIAHTSNVWHLIVAQISCSRVIKMQKIKSNHGLMNMRNEENSEILRIIQPKCPGSTIGAK
jgi:hypothetical protein